jgi:two-component system, NarL family, nitrate/nitrite response regulator NarL
MKEVSLVVIDDHPVLRKGLVETLSAVEGFRVVGEAENGASGLELIESTSPDLAIVDIDMPVMDGIDLVRILRKSNRTVEIVFLTIHKDRSLLRSLPSLGVRGYVLKDSSTEEILECVRTVASGRRFVSAKLEAFEPKPQEEPYLMGIDNLTSSELIVLFLISQSRTSREIADELTVSVRTIDTHRYNITAKLGLKGSHALLKFAVENRSEISNAHNLRNPT